MNHVNTRHPLIQPLPAWTGLLRGGLDPQGLLDMRGDLFDAATARWAAAGGPGGTVVELGCGLGHPRYGLPSPMLWIGVDLPQVIALRNRLCPPGPWSAHIACSALGTAWLDRVPDDQRVHIRAEGLLMHFHPEEVRALVQDVFRRFREVSFVFDTVPRRVVQKAQRLDLDLPLAWGVDASSLADQLQAWVPRASTRTVTAYGDGTRDSLWRTMLTLGADTPTVTLLEAGSARL